jgi:hypothetical protein
MSEIVDALKRELAVLEAELEADPRYRKMARIRALLSEYTAPDVLNITLPSGATIPIRKRSPPEGDTKRAHIHRVVHARLLAEGKVHRSELLRSLQDGGLMSHNEGAMGALAAYLSSFPDFRSAGGGLWELAIADKVEAPTSKPVEAS